MATNDPDASPFRSSVAMSQRAARNPLDESESGWVRTVHAYVQYNACGGLPYRWRLTGPQAYFLRQDESLLAKTRSLGMIADQLTRRRGGSEGPSAEALGELDAVAEALLATAQLLHGEQRQFGIVTRDNVVWNGEQILLMDQGFHVPPDAFPQPPWIAQPPADAVLWDADIATRQNKALPHPDFSPAEDVRLLVRLYQGLLLNVWQKNLVKGPDLRNVYRTRSMDLWDRLRKLMEHPSATPLDDLEKMLANHPLSSHFRSSGGGGNKPVKKRPMVLPLLLLPLALAGGLGAAWKLEVWPFLPETKIGTPPEEKTEPVDVPPVPPVISDLAESLKQLSEQVKALETLEKTVKNLATGNAIPDAQSEQNLINYRERFLEQWSASFPAALDRFRYERTRKEGYQQLNALRDHLLQVRQLTRIPSNERIQEKERQCFKRLQSLQFDPQLPALFRDSLSQ